MASGYGASPRGTMVVVQDRSHEAGLRASHRWRLADGSFHDVPAIVLATGARGGLHVYFLPRSLSHISDVQFARAPVEGEAPRVAKSVGPDLRTGRWPANERIARGDGVG